MHKIQRSLDLVLVPPLRMSRVDDAPRRCLGPAAAVCAEYRDLARWREAKKLRAEEGQ